MKIDLRKYPGVVSYTPIHPAQREGTNMYINQVVLVISQIFLFTFAQQRCYWPNGSTINPDQGAYVNCRANQDSNCCLNGEICLTDGLCFGAYGWMYRGACTVQDWSNTTACPTQWCNDIQTDVWANIWNCAGINNAPRYYWCGDESQVVACQKDSNISNTQSAFPFSTPVSILGFPPVHSTSSAPVAALTTVATRVTLVSETPVTLFSATAASITTSGPSQHSHQAAQQATAIGAGVGVPLGAAAIGFLVLLCWRGTRRANRNKQQRQQRPYSGNGHAQGGSPLANKATRFGAEFPDSQIPRELDHRAGIVEMPALSSS